MRPELRSRLLALARGDIAPKPAVTPVPPVTLVTGYRSNPLKIQGLHGLQVEHSKGGNAANRPVTKAVTAPPEPDPVELEERKAMAADKVPERYLDDWARLQLQRPAGIVDDERWQEVTDDAGRFLDIWGSVAADLGWTANDIFDVPGGIAWFANGSLVTTINHEAAMCFDGRIWRRGILPK
jgi:hypothetical protein